MKKNRRWKAGPPVGLMKRSPASEEISRSEIEDVDCEPDPAFTTAFLSAIAGQLLVAYTRIPIDRIQAGFTRSLADGRTEIVESPEVDNRVVHGLVNEIRRGYRFPLVLYRGGSDRGFTYVCSDDLPALYAYRQAGVRTVPAQIMDPKFEELPHSGLIFRWKGAVSTGRIVEIFERVHAPKWEALPSITGATQITDSMVADVVGRVSDSLRALLARLRQFHVGGGDIHYHESMGSAIARAIRLVSVIGDLLGRGYAEQALVLFRSFYELSLCVYLDWLAPETIGPMFVFYAHGGKDLKVAVQEAEKSRVSEGWDPDAARMSSKSFTKLTDLVRRVDQKAAANPLAPLHSHVYEWLSHQSHQDFAAGSEFTDALGTQEDPDRVRSPHERDDRRLIARYLDLAGGVICECLDSDTAELSKVPPPNDATGEPTTFVRRHVRFD